MATNKKTGSAASTARGSGNQWLIVRRSKVHGNGCFARRFIPKGTRIIEYLGERISHKEADARYEGADVNDNHTFLFIADRRTVIDASTNGNEARWINHHCDGNCESEIEKGRVFVDARRDIEKGEELGYDYQIGRDKNDPPNVDEIYACRCGSPKCRGTMLWPAKKAAPRRKAKSKSKVQARKKAPVRGKSQARKTQTKNNRKSTRAQGRRGERARRRA